MPWTRDQEFAAARSALMRLSARFGVSTPQFHALSIGVQAIEKLLVIRATVRADRGDSDPDWRDVADRVEAACECQEHDPMHFSVGGCPSCGFVAEAPYVCPGCHAVGPERCAPGCIDAEIEAEHRHAIESGDYDIAEGADDA